MWDYDQNGVVIRFEILYVPLETFGGVLVPNTVNTSASDRSAILTGLQEYVEYSISIRSYTPFSPNITGRTLETGNILIHKVVIVNYIIIIVPIRPENVMNRRF